MSHAHGLIGREPELERIERFLDTVPAGPAALVIEGEPGIGKTELWRAALGCAEARGFEARSARAAQAEARLSLSVLIDLLEPLPEEVCDRLSPPRREALLAALLRATAVRVPHHRTLGVAVLDVIRDLATDRPLLLAVDDEHWLDRSTAAVLAFALRRLRAEPVGYLAVMRTGPMAPTRDLPVPAPDAEHLALGPLDLAAIDILIEERTSIGLPLPTLHRVYELCRGNPLFALAIVRGIPSDDLQIPPGRTVPVAEDLRDPLRRRLERLPDATQDALVAVAVAADPPLGQLASIVGDPVVLDPAIAEGVLEIVDGSVRFTHPLLAAVAAGEASEDRRREIHRAAGASATDPEARARHLALAAERPDGGVAAALDEAARTARSRGALPDAAELSDLAVHLTPTGRTDDLARRRIAAATYRFLAGDDVEGIARIDEVLRTIPSGPLRAEAILVLSRRTFEDVTRTVTLLDDALRQEPLDASLQADLHVQYAWTLWRAADPRSAHDHATAALRLAEAAGDPRLTCDALAILGAITWALGRPRPDELLRRALALEPEAVDAWLYVSDRPGLVVADLLGHDARFEEAIPIFADLLRDARQAGDEPSVASVLWNLGTLEILSGDWGLAREHLSEAVRIRRQEGTRPMESLASLAVLRACEGDVERARADAAEAIETSRDWDDLTGRLFCLQAAGLIELAAGAPATACEPLTSAARLIRSTALRSPDLCPIVADEVEALLACGRIDEADPEVAWLQEWTRELGGWTPALAARSRGYLLASRGDLEGARSALRGAVVELDRVGIPFEAARAYLILGTVERRAKRKRAAREAFGRAAEIFDALGAPAWTDRARAELGRVGGRPPAPLALTETERQVAALAAAGRTNREVAEALFMSPRTVEGHLSRTYRKLGIRSRTQLAATLLDGRDAAVAGDRTPTVNDRHLPDSSARPRS